MAIYIGLIGAGLGDVIVGLPIIHWLIKNQPQEVFLVARSTRQLGFDRLIPGLAGTVIEPQVKELLQDGDRWINLRDHELQTKWDWDSKEFQDKYPQATIYSVLETICHDFEIHPSFESKTKLPCHKDPRGKDMILLVPGTTGIRKHLVEDTWFDLIDRLQERKFAFSVVGEAENSSIVKKLIAAGVPHILTATIEDAVNVISNSRLVISVDTGLMHIALNQEIRTIAILPKRSFYYRPQKLCTPLFALETEPSPTNSVEGFPSVYAEFTWWDGKDNEESVPIYSIKSEQILNAVDKELNLIS